MKLIFQVIFFMNMGNKSLQVKQRMIRDLISALSSKENRSKGGGFFFDLSFAFPSVALCVKRPHPLLKDVVPICFVMVEKRMLFVYNRIEFQ